MEEELKKQQKQEALNRLRLLQKKYELMETVIKEYQQEETIYYSEYQNKVMQGILYWTSNSEELTNAIKEFEEKYQALVYHAILVPTIYGRLFCMLYISKDTEEWQRDREDLNEGLPIAYCRNLDDNSTSEFGTIQIKGANGGLTRIA